MPRPVTIETAAIPDGFCFAGFRASWPYLSSLLSASVTEINGASIGPDIPSQEDQDKPWVRTNADGSPDRTYIFNQGIWSSRHPYPVGLVKMWDGVGSINTFDGGEAAPVGLYTGPFWEIYTTLNARMPIGIGKLPSKTEISFESQGGSEAHALTLKEMTRHAHRSLDIVNNPIMDPKGPSSNGPQWGTFDQSDHRTGSAGSNVAHNNMPPYSGIYFIRRTARLFYRV